MYTYILNPFNLKKINIHSTMGKSILKNYLKSLLGSGVNYPIPKNSTLNYNSKKLKKKK